MGMNFLGSASRYSQGFRRPGDPNPERFSVREVYSIGDFTIARVHYPDCTTFEGMKILVYSGHVAVQVNSATKLDPHFTGEGLSPLARFEPTEHGLAAARETCKALSGL